MHELIYSQENKYRILRHGIFCMSIFFLQPVAHKYCISGRTVWSIIPFSSFIRDTLDFIDCFLLLYNCLCSGTCIYPP